MNNYLRKAVVANKGAELPVLERHAPASSKSIVMLDTLWIKVQTNNLRALQLIHKIVYPALYRYGVFILDNVQAVDDILEQAFVNFWIDRANLNAETIKALFVQSIRKDFFNYLSISGIQFNDCLQAFSTSMQTPVSYIRFSQQEVAFLRFGLLLNNSEIAVITGIASDALSATDNEQVFDEGVFM